MTYNDFLLISEIILVEIYNEFWWPDRMTQPIRYIPYCNYTVSTPIITVVHMLFAHSAGRRFDLVIYLD